MARHARGFPGAFTQTMKGFDPESPATKDGLVAHREFYERFYRPAHERRTELVLRFEAGELDEEDLPNDLITLIVRHVDPALDDEDLAVRETIFLIPAASATTATTTVRTLDELFSWFEQHPEDFEKRFDSDFLNRATHEALRLHPITPGQPRLALEDFELCKGTKVRKDDVPSVISGPGNVQEDVFGPDALEFDPYRKLPRGVPGYGLAFGAGAHMCAGIPLALGQQGIDGNVVFWLRTLFEAGVEIDPDNPPTRFRYERGIARPQGTGGTHIPEGYPVRFRTRASS
jgi:cytochrome P450